MTKETEALLMSPSSEEQPEPETVRLDEQGLHDILKRHTLSRKLTVY